MADADPKTNDVSWALKILEREPDYQESIYSRWIHQGWCSFVGFVVPVTANHMLRRPIWAGFQTHIACTVAGFAIGTYLRKREIDILARNDAILRDYIVRHPEDFPEPDRKTYGELFLEWVPMR